MKTIRLSDLEPAPSVRFIERHDLECGWIPDTQDKVPISERLCCGAPVPPDRPYKFCDHHWARATGGWDDRNVQRTAG